MAEALGVCLGREAARRIAREGWSAHLFDLLLGASGGAKWLILGHLDRLLFGDFLQRSDRPITALGSSIGAWRHACLANPDPVAAIDRFERAYLQQQYSSRPSADEISEVSLAMLRNLFGPAGASHLVDHPRIRSHIVTSRGLGPAASSSNAVLAMAMGGAALGNTLSRRLLRLQFQRVVFHTGTRPDRHLGLRDFHTYYSRLNADNITPALHASGSIPFVLTGERDIPGGPPGQYWDGGIIDYHFDLTQYHGDGLILYPHFSERLFPGWFDKFLPWRGAAPRHFERLVLLYPRPEFIADLPFGKIPDRADFRRLRREERVRYWETCIERSRALAEEFAELLQRSDPLRGVAVSD